MKITEIAKKPQLIEISLDSAEVMAEYGEVITFHTWDRQPLDVFIKLAAATEENKQQILLIAKDLILDETGKPVLSDGAMLHTKILMQAIEKIVQILGK